MIKIDHNLPAGDDWEDWAQRCKNKREGTIEAFNKGEDIAFSDLYKEKKNEYFLSKNGPFHGKCAYCEQPIAGNQPGDVEHYRPKGSGVTDENHEKVYIEDETGANENHPGYYWLAYEFTNLLASCNQCNRPNTDRESPTKLGKRQSFPVTGNHATKPDDEPDEEPLILNPTVDNPDEHFELLDNGILSLKTPQAKITDKVLGLNLRNLPASRKERYSDIEDKAINILHSIVSSETGSEKFQNKLKELIKSFHGYGAFSLAARKAIKAVDDRYSPNADGVLIIKVKKYG